MQIAQRTICLLIATLSSMAFSAPVKKDKTYLLTPDDAVYLAVRNNPNVLIANNNRVTQKYSLLLAENNFMPQYSMTGQYQVSQGRSGGVASQTEPSYSLGPQVTLNNHIGTQFTLSMANSVSDGNYNPGVTFQIVQPLMRGFGKAVVDAALEDAIDTEYTNKLQYKQTAMDTVVNTLNDYFAVVEAKETLKISYQSLEQNLQTIKNDQALIKAGRMAGADIVQAKAQVATTLSTIEENKNSLKSAKTTLLDELGLSPNTVIDVPTNFNFLQIVNHLTNNGRVPSLSESTKLALTNNSDYQVARVAIGSLARGIITAEDANRPQLNLTLATTRGGGTGDGENANLQSLYNGRNYNNSAELNLDVPIDNMSNKAAIVNAKIGLQNGYINLAEAKRSLIESVRTDYENLQTSKTQLKLSEQAMQLQEETYNINKQKFLAGKISNFELLTQQQDLTTAKNSLISSQISYLNAITSFEDQIGVALAPWHIKVRY